VAWHFPGSRRETYLSIGAGVPSGQLSEHVRGIRPRDTVDTLWRQERSHIAMAFTTTMLAWGAVENREAYASWGQLTPLLKDLRVPNDWFISA
jgi:hypothetical protein